MIGESVVPLVIRRCRNQFRVRPSNRMLTVADVAAYLNELAPPALAEPWDNVGLLVGRHEQTVTRVMTCLTITPASAREAVDARAELIVSHHPLPFHALKRLTAETGEGRLLLELIAAKISVFSPHTAFDSARQGINERLARGLELTEIAPLVPGDEPGQGAGRNGRLASPMTLEELASKVKRLLEIDHLQAVGSLSQSVARVAVACGSAGEFLAAAKAAGCDCLVTGEVRFHACLEAESLGMGLVLAGHFASERFAVDQLAAMLAETFPTLQVWASRQERDPLQWL
jgi:dinuclear metal center YbgI/SA1388 family protein